MIPPASRHVYADGFTCSFCGTLNPWSRHDAGEKRLRFCHDCAWLLNELCLRDGDVEAAV